MTWDRRGVVGLCGFAVAARAGAVAVTLSRRRRLGLFRLLAAAASGGRGGGGRRVDGHRLGRRRDQPVRGLLSVLRSPLRSLFLGPPELTSPLGDIFVAKSLKFLKA